MIRPARPEALASLRAAAEISDAALDLALMRVGILPPADLDEIRSYLRHPSNRLEARTTQLGFNEIDVVTSDRTIARILNDGSVFALAGSVA